MGYEAEPGGRQRLPGGCLWRPCRRRSATTDHHGHPERAGGYACAGLFSPVPQWKFLYDRDGVGPRWF
ncbi:hypothetical protein HNR25_002168 [Streptomonospora salina]|uniref:Uncharacterized protein n=1 Tax=Streptomonospora salina TaxID=104205 RepID=A0A841E3J7_9ACTN|nr:hypothetical protein [Streptomonospora salina]